MCFCGFFHSRRNIDRASIDTNCPFGITLFAHNNIAAMDPYPKVGDDPELLSVIGLLVPDCNENRVNRAQYLVCPDRFTPRPQCNQTISFIKVDIAAGVGDRP